MILTITTTHAIPQTSTSNRDTSRLSGTFCSYCFRTLPSGAEASQRMSFTMRHNCPEMSHAKQPSISVPFN
jgi:hypothetical protein